jgi:N-acetyl-anhydromuramyl-L-alanine amidase AmpD
VRWIILHDPGVTAPVGNILASLDNPSLKASYHLVFSDEPRPKVYEVVPIKDVAWHAGAFSQIPGTNVRNSDVNTFTWSLSMLYPLPERSYPALVQAVADMIVAAELPDAGVVLAHHEVSTVPGRRSDPRGIDMGRLRNDVQRVVDRLRSE